MDDLLIGTANFCDLTGIPSKSCQWFRVTESYAFPPSELTVDDRDTWICRASTALAWARDQDRYDGPVPDPMALPDLVSTRYVREVSGYARKTVQAMCLPKRVNGEVVGPSVLPPPAFRVSRVPLWERETIDEWAAARKVSA